MKSDSSICKNGHDKLVTGVTSKGRCVECKREANRKSAKKKTLEQKAARAEYLRRWRAENLEKNREYDRKYYWQNPEKARAESAAYREAHKDDPKKPPTPERLAYLKQYHIDNADREKAYRASRKHIQDAYNENYYSLYKVELLKDQKEYYKRNKEVIAQRSKEWRKRNPVKVKKNAKVQKHNRRGALGTLSTQLISNVWELCGGQCAYCPNKVTIDGDWHLEHCIPISRGGTNFEDNLVVSCTDCNNPKYRSTVLEHLLNWPKVTERYDFFVEQSLLRKDLLKLNKLHAKYKTGPIYFRVYDTERP